MSFLIKHELLRKTGGWPSHACGTLSWGITQKLHSVGRKYWIQWHGLWSYSSPPLFLVDGHHGIHRFICTCEGCVEMIYEAFRDIWPSEAEKHVIYPCSPHSHYHSKRNRLIWCLETPHISMPSTFPLPFKKKQLNTLSWDGVSEVTLYGATKLGG